MKNSSVYSAVLVGVMTISGFAAIPAGSSELAPVYKIAYGESKDIDAHGVCKTVTNTGASGHPVTVPIETAGEWADFRENLPSGVTVKDCLEPCEIKAVGTVCLDGAIYAGNLENTRLYAAPSDEGRFAWNSGSTNFREAGTPSFTNGPANTETLFYKSRGETFHKAALACRNKGPKWYLPALAELNVLYANRGLIGGFDETGDPYLLTGSYWSSTEATTDSAYIIQFNVNGNYTTHIKAAALSVRCVRR